MNQLFWGQRAQVGFLFNISHTLYK